MLNLENAYNYTNGAAFPNTEAIDSSDGNTPDGTEYEAKTPNQSWGFHQAVLFEAGLVPNDIQESASLSQILQGIKLILNKEETLEEVLIGKFDSSTYVGAHDVLSNSVSVTNNGGLSGIYVDGINDNTQSEPRFDGYFIYPSPGVSSFPSWFNPIHNCSVSVPIVNNKEVQLVAVFKKNWGRLIPGAADNTTSGILITEPQRVVSFPDTTSFDSYPMMLVFKNESA